jgi:hypothetical protein
MLKNEILYKNMIDDIVKNILTCHRLAQLYRIYIPFLTLD